ncbi:MAG: sulfatase-like hydrolase/transferase [Pirellulales bacterium]
MICKVIAPLVLFLGTVSIATPLQALQEKGSKPNVVLILADDLGWGDLGCFGAKEIRTPRLDQLAAQGVRFEQFYVSQAVCTASRAALMTGCYANRVGMSGALNHTSPNGIHPQEVLLSNLFKDQGYATAIFGKWHLGHHPPFLPTRRGFDEWAGLPYSNDNGPLHPVSPDFPALPWYENEQVTELDPDQSSFTHRITNRCVEFIRQHRQQPFFLYVPHIMPHVPIFASESFRGKSKAGLYGDVVEELDASIGQIVDVIEELGLSENTLILFASDNGPFLSYGEHAGSAGKLREGKLTCYEGGMRVPAIARWKGRIASGKTSQAMISTIDLYATLGKLIGAQLPDKKRDSLELLPVLLGDELERGRPQYWYYAGEELQAVRDRRWKLHLPHRYLTVAGPPGVGGKPSMHGRGNPQSIEQSGIYGIASRHGYRVESTELALYDLNQDPSERENVAHLHPDIVARLTKMAEEARRDLGDSITQVTPTHARAAGDVRPRLPEGVRVVSNRTYATRKTGALLLDLYLPQKPSSSSLPTVVWMHGGGWASGAKENCPWTWLPSEGFRSGIDRLSFVPCREVAIATRGWTRCRALVARACGRVWFESPSFRYGRWIGRRTSSSFGWDGIPQELGPTRSNHSSRDRYVWSHRFVDHACKCSWTYESIRQIGDHQWCQASWRCGHSASRYGSRCKPDLPCASRSSTLSDSARIRGYPSSFGSKHAVASKIEGRRGRKLNQDYRRCRTWWPRIRPKRNSPIHSRIPTQTSKTGQIAAQFVRSSTPRPSGISDSC